MTSPSARPAWVDVICDGCGLYYSRHSHVLAVSLAVVDGQTGELRDLGDDVAPMRIGPCPRCGDNGVVVSGVKEMVRGVARTILAADPAVIADIQAIRADLEALALAIPGLTAAQAADHLEARSPQLSALSSWLRENQHLATWLAVVLSLLALLETRQQAGQNQPLRAKEIESIVKGVVGSRTDKPEPQPAPPSRNAPCTCGSEKKYKLCHGRAGATTHEP